MPVKIRELGRIAGKITKRRFDKDAMLLLAGSMMLKLQEIRFLLLE